jgi:hypothetical protein
MVLTNEFQLKVTVVTVENEALVSGENGLLGLHFYIRSGVEGVDESLHLDAFIQQKFVSFVGEHRQSAVPAAHYNLVGGDRLNGGHSCELQCYLWNRQRR